MSDVHIEKPEPGKVGAIVEDLIEQGHDLYATAITGAPSGRVRRPTLFLIAEVGIIVSLVLDGAVGLIAGGLAMIAILLLAMSDHVVEL